MKKLYFKVTDLFDKGLTADEIGKILCINPNLAAEIIDDYIVWQEEEFMEDQKNQMHSFMNLLQEIIVFLRLMLAVEVAKKLVTITGMNLWDACRAAANRYDVDSEKVYRILTE